MTGQSGPDPRHSMASHAPHRLFPIHTPHRPLKVTDIDRMTDPRTHMGRPIPYPTKSLAPANPRMIIRRSAHALMLVALCLSGLALAAGAGGAKQEVAVTPLVCVVCVSAQGAEPSREAIEQALAYNVRTHSTCVGASSFCLLERKDPCARRTRRIDVSVSPSFLVSRVFVPRRCTHAGRGHSSLCVSAPSSHHSCLLRIPRTHATRSIDLKRPFSSSLSSAPPNQPIPPINRRRTASGTGCRI